MKAKTFLSEKELWGSKDTYWTRKRTEKILNFIDEINEPAADMGVRNPLIENIESTFNIRVKSFDTMDFDVDPLKGEYSTIFCFAILEHLFNPLFALENMRKVLKPGGKIYLSTPHRPHFLWTEHHFHEMDTTRILWLFEKAGFEIVKHERQNLRDRWIRHFRGFRPFCRFFIKPMGLYKLRKTEDR